MPDFAIIDSHVHVFDVGALPYTWTARLPPALRVSRTPADLIAATAPIAVESAVVIEFLVDRGHHLAEAAFGQALADAQPSIAAVVANAPVELGSAVEPDIARLAAMPAVRGVRRIIEAGHFDMALEPAFIDGVRLVGAHGLVFEIGVDYAGLGHALQLVRRCPEVTFVLDHLGTPPIREHLVEPWRSQIVEFAAAPNVIAKLSGLMAGADPATWAKAQVARYVEHAIDSFGPGRVMFGSDWPMLTPVVSYAGWVEIVDLAVGQLDRAQQHSIYRDVAIKTYRL